MLYRECNCCLLHFFSTAYKIGKNPVCPVVRTGKVTPNKDYQWSNTLIWANGIVPKKVDVAMVSNTVPLKFSLLATKGDFALDLRLQNNKVDLVVGRGKTGRYLNTN